MRNASVLHINTMKAGKAIQAIEILPSKRNKLDFETHLKTALNHSGFCNAKGFLYPFTRNLKNAKYDVSEYAEIKKRN